VDPRSPSEESAEARDRPAADGPPPPRWRRLLRWTLRWTFRVGLVTLVAGGIGGWYGYQWFEREILSSIPERIDRNTQFRIPLTVRVYAADGERVDQFYLERRTWVDVKDLPAHVWQAFVASEDRRFFEHPGVDPIGILRALVVNLRGGSTRQGGSTITQQLVKNLLVGKERSYRRKLREAVLAWRLERELSKMELVELYINYVALGSGNYGVEAAAQDYFGISAREMDAGQAALLAGLVPAPSKYSPRQNPELAGARREQVLRLMVEQGYITAIEASNHLQDAVVVPRVSADSGPNTAFLTETRREVRRLLGEDRPFLEGLQIHTPLDTRVQAVAEQAVREALTALEAREGARGPVRNIPADGRAAFLERGDKLQIDPQTQRLRAPRAGECFMALAEDATGRLAASTFRFQVGKTDLERKVRVTVSTPDPRGGARPTVSRVPMPLGAALKAGDVLEVCVPEQVTEGEPAGVVHLRERPWAEAAAVVLENRTGNVVALVGGYDVGLEGFVRATQAKRQPGSSFKPFVYAAAVVAGKRQTDIVLDAPFAVTGTNGRPWSPKNYDGKYHGAIPLRNAMALSLNTVAVRLGYEVGIDKVVGLANALGVRTPLRRDLTVALGSSEVTPMDLAVAYSSIAREGVRIDPVFITRVLDRSGRELGHAGSGVDLPGETPIALPGPPGERVMDAADAYVVLDMMRNVFGAGTAKKGRRDGFDFGGKTGTTSSFVDAWFVGYSPRYTTAVWVGTDGTASIGDKETGGKAALPAWSRIMEALPNESGERFVVPDGVVLLPSGDTWLGYRRGTAPTELLPVPPRLGDQPLPPFGGARPLATVLPPAVVLMGDSLDLQIEGSGDLEAGAGDLEMPDLVGPQMPLAGGAGERETGERE
jgi:penicillin-binding protein 1A